MRYIFRDERRRGVDRRNMKGSEEEVKVGQCAESRVRHGLSALGMV